jgi:hypothetical protein
VSVSSNSKRVVSLNPGGYAFGEKPIVRVVGSGKKVSLWVGLNNINGSCLGELSGGALDALLDAIAVARGEKMLPKRIEPSERISDRAMGTKVNYDGRRRRGSA